MDEQFVRNWLRAWTGNQPKTLRSFYTEDAYYRDPFHRDGIKGEQLLPYFEKLLARNPDWKWELLEMFAIEKGFCVKWQAMIPVGSKILTEIGVDILQFQEGLISRNEVYFDTSRLMAARP